MISPDSTLALVQTVWMPSSETTLGLRTQISKPADPGPTLSPARMKSGAAAEDTSSRLIDWLWKPANPLKLKKIYRVFIRKCGSAGRWPKTTFKLMQNAKVGEVLENSTRWALRFLKSKNKLLRKWNLKLATPHPKNHCLKYAFLWCSVFCSAAYSWP